LVAEGKIPYLDFTDHKGVLVFYLNGLAYLMGGKFGICFLSFLCFFISFFLISITVKEMLGSEKEAYVASFILFFLMSFTEGGNQVGFICLPFVFLPFYFYFKALKKQQPNYFLIGSFLAGLEVGISFNSRPSDGVVVLGLFVYYFIWWLRNKRGWGLLYNFLLAILGFAIPMVIFYSIAYAQGYISEMIQMVFKENSNYIFHHMSVTSICSFICVFLWVIFSLFFSIKILKEKDKELGIFFICVSLLSGIPNLVYAKYPQYWITSFPYMTCLLILIIHYYPLLTKKKKNVLSSKNISALSFSLSILIGLGFVTAFYTSKDSFSSYYNYSITQEIAESGITTEEFETEDKVFALDISASFNLRYNNTSSLKQISYQSWHSFDDSTVESEVNTYLQEKKPVYIIQGKNGLENYSSLSYFDYINNHYEKLPDNYPSNELSIWKLKA
jgi:hypothetical protein